MIYWRSGHCPQMSELDQQLDGTTWAIWVWLHLGIMRDGHSKNVCSRDGVDEPALGSPGAVCNKPRAATHLRESVQVSNKQFHS